LRRIRKELRAADDPAERTKYRKTKRRARVEIFQLENELRAARGDASQAGALPDFLVIGAQKCGTTSLYRHLARHPHVRPAAHKELHYFDMDSDESIESYRLCFPPPMRVDGRETITGEATPSYIYLPHVPERVAKAVPGARLIALLRNPVDRAYSHYHHRIWVGSETGGFEEAIEEEAERLRGEGSKPKADEHGAGSVRASSSYLARGLYVDQLQRWSSFFDDEQMLVLKSEAFFARPEETVKRVLEFLGLPDWEPLVSKPRNKGRYAPMDSAIRRRLEEYFEPHNRRLYDYLGVDFGW
jgi:hypothetical protein